MSPASSVSHLLNVLVEVKRRQVSADGMGGQKVAWQSVGEEGARVSSPPSSTTAGVLAAAQTSERVPFYVYLEPSSEVRRGDVLVVEDDGRQLWVEAVTWPSVRAYKRAACRDWQAAPDETIEGLMPEVPTGGGG